MTNKDKNKDKDNDNKIKFWFYLGVGTLGLLLLTVVIALIYSFAKPRGVISSAPSIQPVPITNSSPQVSNRSTYMSSLFKSTGGRKIFKI
jgi:hypothetical protein